MHIAVFGCGQLARMMALAGWRMGFTFSFVATPGEGRQCVKGLGDIIELTPDLQGEALFKALGSPAVLTVEREHVDLDILNSLQPFCAVHPSTEAIAISQHRGREKQFLSGIGIPTAPYRLSQSANELRKAVNDLGYPVLAKVCLEGYDGRGQFRVNDAKGLEELLKNPVAETELVIEGMVNFDKEVSVIAARNPDGNTAIYPITENCHKDGILLSSIAPAELPCEQMQRDAEQIVGNILNELNYVGVLAVEFFVVGNTLVVNELAPRVHNSGHWTQSAGITSQFENHLRSINGLSLGNTQPATYTAMINLLGQSVEQNLLNQGNVELHQYNKSLRPNRKVGHINLWDINRSRLLTQLDSIKQSLRSNPPDH